MSDGQSDYLRLTGMHAPPSKSYEIGSGECLHCVQRDGVHRRDCPEVNPSEKPVQTSDEHPTFFPGDRKAYPVFTGLLMYFPDACAAVANCSHIANEQHNPGEPVHWDRSKSIGEGNEVLRHLMDGTRSPLDTDKVLHYSKAAWRMFELLQRQIEAMRGK